MGCVSLKKERLTSMVPSKSVNGLLKVTIEEANIMKPPSKLFSLDPYLRIRISNQQYRGFIHRKAGRLDLFNESFQFIINSCYKSEGRFVCIEVWDKHVLGDRMIGTGTIDIDPIINFDEKNMIGSQLLQVNKAGQNNKIQRSPSRSRISQCKRKLFLTHGTQQAGYLNTKFEFFQQPVTVVGFKFIYANLRRTSSIFTTMHIRIQVIAGQQVLSTQKHKDKDSKNPPSWQDEILMFNIPTSLKQCVIRVLDESQEVGRYKLQFSQIIGQKGEHKFTQQLQSDHGISGVIKFIALVGVTSIVNDSRKILQMQESRQRIDTNIQPTLKTKFQLPPEKQIKLYDSSEAKTNFQTQANQQQHSKNNYRPQSSVLFIDQHQIRH